MTKRGRCYDVSTLEGLETLSFMQHREHSEGLGEHKALEDPDLCAAKGIADEANSTPRQWE